MHTYVLCGHVDCIESDYRNKNCFFQLCTAAMCNMAENFDDPEMFNPSRFDRSNEQ